MPGDLPRPVLEILASAREDILILQNQKKVLNNIITMIYVIQCISIWYFYVVRTYKKDYS